MINIHFGDREIFVVSHPTSTSGEISRLPFDNCSEMVRKTKGIIEEFLAVKNNTTFILTGNISIALDLRLDFEKSRTLYQIAHDVIEFTLTSCVRQFSKRKIFDNVPFDESSKIPNSSRLVSLEGANFNNNLTARQIKKLLNREFVTSKNPPADLRNKLILKAVIQGGWVDALYQLHQVFFSTPMYTAGRYFVLKDVDTMCDDTALKKRYSELVGLLAYKPSITPDIDGFVVIDISGVNFGDAEKKEEKLKNR